MERIALYVWDGTLGLAMWFAICAGLFTALAFLTPGIRGQKFFRRGFATDAVYWFLLPFPYAFLEIILVTVGVLLLAGSNSDIIQDWMQGGRAPVNGWPLWIQVACVIVMSDLFLYWVHRAFHGRKLWRFHAIHHMPCELDWLSGARFHPVNYVLSFSLTGAAGILIGFAPEALALLIPFNILYSAFVHANLNWTLGPLRYVLASPVFHRWHHTSPKYGGDKNFAPTFSLIDVLFGTFYMPEGKKPEDAGFGIHEEIEERFLAQMLWPLRRNKNARR